MQKKINIAPTSRTTLRQGQEKSLGSSSRAAGFRLADWKIGHVLGQGQFGFVVEARNVHTRKVVAWKRFPTQRLLSAAQRRSRALELVEREIHIHQSIHHPNILSFLGYTVDPEYVTLVLEYTDKGDLFDYSNKHCVTCMDRVRLFHRVYPAILAAVSYLESLQIAHRDIKPENILLKTINTDNNRNVVGENVLPLLCDFGWSCWYLKAGARQSTICGTPEYVPPELLSGDTSRRRYAAEFVDSWALGVLALEVLQGETPFGAPENCDTSEMRPAIYAKIRSFGGLDTSLCTDLNRLAALAVNGHKTSFPPPVPVVKNERYFSYVSMVKDFLQPTPFHRLSASDCLERYAHLFGSTNQPAPHRPSVKQRRQIFQNNLVAPEASIIF